MTCLPYFFYLFILIAPQFLRADVAYVCDNLSDTISVIDTTNNTVIDTIFLPIILSSPQSVAITPDSRFAYVTTDGHVLVIDTTINAFIATIPVGAPTDIFPDIAIIPNGKFAYLTDKNNGNVHVIDTATNTLTGSPIAVGTNPQGIACTPDGNFVYVANAITGSVSVIDTGSNTVIDTVTIVPNLTKIAITPDSLFAYVTEQSFSGHVYAINIPSNTVVATIPVGTFPTGIAITPNGHFAYVANSSDATLSVINITLNSVVDTVALPETPALIAITFDGSSAYVTQANGSGTVSKIDLTTNSFTGISIPVGHFPVAIALTTIVNGVSNLTGKQKTEDFGVEYQKYNVLDWLPSTSPNIVNYQLFRNGISIATLDSSVHKYSDTNVKKHSVNTYTVIAIDSLGHKSAPQSVTIQ